jgi:hypothetical protein
VSQSLKSENAKSMQKCSKLSLETEILIQFPVGFERSFQLNRLGAQKGCIKGYEMYEKTWRNVPPNDHYMALFVYLTWLKGAGDVGMDLQHTCKSKKV